MDDSGRRFSMTRSRHNRRSFLGATAGTLAAGMAGPLLHAGEAAAQEAKATSKNDRIGLGAIGMRYQGSVITHKALPYGDVVAICDVDQNVREQARASFGSTPAIYEHYHDLLARKDVDVVLIGTPDHWHVPIAIDACKAGKDVYCEKPLTLTIDEGKLLCKVVRETGAVVQVGTWQRSDWKFRLAAEMVRAGRIARLRKVTIVLDKNPVGGPFRATDPPPHLNWDLWLGQAPKVPFMYERCHYTFRWWHEYAGGKTTDWGAHHLDIGQWAMGMQFWGPVEVAGKAKFPNAPDSYNVPIDFEATFTYADGTVMRMLDTGENGITFEGDDGAIFVNRSKVTGKPVDALKDDPLDSADYKLYPHDLSDTEPRTGKLASLVTHMENFFHCVRERKTPISDVVSQHRSASICHLANIAMHLGRKLKWDPGAERFVDDAEANALLSRKQREGYEIRA